MNIIKLFVYPSNYLSPQNIYLLISGDEIVGDVFNLLLCLHLKIISIYLFLKLQLIIIIIILTLWGVKSLSIKINLRVYD